MVVAILAFSVSSFASNEYNVLWVLNDRTTFNEVAEFIDADYEQKQQLSEISFDSTQRLKEALVENNKDAAMKALYYNLANAKSILSPTQYKKYLSILNTTYKKQLEVFSAE